MRGIVTRQQLIGFYTELLAAPGDAARDRIIDMTADMLDGNGPASADGAFAFHETHEHFTSAGKSVTHAHGHSDGHRPEDDGDHNSPGHLDLPGHENLFRPDDDGDQDAGQLSNSYGGGRSGSAYELAARGSALADIGAMVDAQTYDAAAAAEQDAADAWQARDLRTRGHRISAEERLSHLLDRVAEGTYNADTTDEAYARAAMPGASDGEASPDDMAATAAVGIHHGIAADFWAEHEMDGLRGARVLGDPDADDRDAALEDLMPDVSGYSGYLRTQGW